MCKIEVQNRSARSKCERGEVRSLSHDAQQLRSTHLGSIVLDGSLASQITLVADEQLVDAFCSIPVDLLQPLLDVGKGICEGEPGLAVCDSEHGGIKRNTMGSSNVLTLVGNVVDDNDTMCSAVVLMRGRGTESALPALTFFTQQFHVLLTDEVMVLKRSWPAVSHC